MSAFRIFGNRAWTAADDHTQATLGKQAQALGLLDDALVSFFDLVSGGDTPVLQKMGYLREFLTIYKVCANTR